MLRFAIRAAALSLAAILLLVPRALADFEAGQRAWDAGDPVEALAQWSAAAEEGDPRAMLALGRLYGEGLGVLRDYVEAYKWFDLAASRGNAEAASERNELSASMMPEQLVAGQSLARVWRPGAGQGSDPVEAGSPPPEIASPSLSPPDAIREAQSLLSALGYQPGPVDGIWGRRSIEAYRSFLRDAGLPAADALTPQALLAMRSIAQRGDPQAGPDAPPPEAIREVQDLLAELGYEAGPADGQWDVLTAQAYAAFLGDAGLPATSALTPEGLRALHARAEAQGAAEEAERLVREWPAGKEFQDCAACPEIVVVPAGSFRMGSPEGEILRSDDEGPLHRVEISKPFAVGKYEVTFAQWDACVSAGGCSNRPDDEGWGRGTRPVINISWDDARSYVEWLSGETGARYRLLSEAEWEYAARAGTTGPFHFGSTISTDNANYDGVFTYGSGDRGVYREKTVPVGSFPANGFGLHDMHGNVWEWVEDCWHDSYSGAPTDESAWTTGGNCSRRAVRGGSWNSTPGSLRSASRLRSSTGVRYYSIGFRVSRTRIP